MDSKGGSGNDEDCDVASPCGELEWTWSFVCFWLCWVRLFSSCSEQGRLIVAGPGPFIAVASPVQSTNSWALGFQ